MITKTTVNKTIKKRLIKWLAEEYTEEEAIEQIETAVIRKVANYVYVITYDNGVKNIVEITDKSIIMLPL